MDCAYEYCPTWFMSVHCEPDSHIVVRASAGLLFGLVLFAHHIARYIWREASRLFPPATTTSTTAASTTTATLNLPPKLRQWMTVRFQHQQPGGHDENDEETSPCLHCA